MLLAGCAAMVAGNVLLAFATTPGVAAIALMLIGINFGVSWPAFNSLIATVVEGDMRQKYFGVNFALVNLGIGVGGMVGGLYVDVSEPSTFTTIYLLDAVTALIPALLLLGPLRHVSGRAALPEDDATAAGASYRAILRQPAVLWLTGLTFVAVFVGYGQFEAGFPGYGRQVAEVSTTVIGMAFAVNTAVIVLLQFLVLTRISGHRRTRVIAVMAVVWASSWLLLGATGVVPGTALAAMGMLGFMGVFAFGETLMQPTVPAISNDLAADHTRGRYNAISSAAFQGGAIAGPVVAGLLLEHDLAVLYVALMVVGCLGIGVMASGARAPDAGCGKRCRGGPAYASRRTAMTLLVRCARGGSGRGWSHPNRTFRRHSDVCHRLHHHARHQRRPLGRRRPAVLADLPDPVVPLLRHRRDPRDRAAPPSLRVRSAPVR